jgi:hypothetical protein
MPKGFKVFYFSSLENNSNELFPPYLTQKKKVKPQKTEKKFKNMPLNCL